ncbi:RNA-binding protein, putative [Hepatocystis sp. ex Piliocolobus tephrosceles]|nr:RNA-binding protein, putative [Hepatocystis sp. ex Piliocolobus tephrosceles]
MIDFMFSLLLMLFLAISFSKCLTLKINRKKINCFIMYSNVKTNASFTFLLKEKYSYYTNKNNKFSFFNKQYNNKKKEKKFIILSNNNFNELNKETKVVPKLELKSFDNEPIKEKLKKTKKFYNYLTTKLGRLNKKLREIKKIETIFYTNPNILTEQQQIKLSKKKQIKNEITLISRYRKKYLAYKRNLMKNIDDTSPFFCFKKKKKKKEICTNQEFRDMIKFNNFKAPIQKIKVINTDNIPKNITDYLVYNEVGSKEDIKILFGLKAIKVNGNIIEDENYILNIVEDEVMVFNNVINIHEHHYAVKKRLTRDQKRIIKKKEKEKTSEIEHEVKQFETFFNIKK